MYLRRLRGSFALGLMVAASACATQSNDGPLGSESGGAAGESAGGEATGGGMSSAGAGAKSGAAGSMAGAGTATGGAGAGTAGGSSAGAASGGTSGMNGSAGAAKGGSGGSGTAGGGMGGGGMSGGGMGGGGKGGGGMGGGGAAGAPSAGAGGGGNTCGTPTSVTLNSIYDAEINAALPTTNVPYVAEANIVRGGANGAHRAVFWFDLSTVPAGKTLKTAQLSLTIANNPGLNKTLSLYRISQTSNRLWKETEVTWQVYKAGSNWTAAGGDFVSAASDSKVIEDNTPAGTALTYNVLADAQSFYATPGTNYGWLLRDPLDITNPSGEHVYIATRENTTIAPPKLVITYCP